MEYSPFHPHSFFASLELSLSSDYLPPDTHEMTPPATRMNLVILGRCVVFACCRGRRVGRKVGFFSRAQRGRDGSIVILGVYEKGDNDVVNDDGG